MKNIRQLELQLALIQNTHLVIIQGPPSEFHRWFKTAFCWNHNNFTINIKLDPEINTNFRKQKARPFIVKPRTTGKYSSRACCNSETSETSAQSSYVVTNRTQQNQRTIVSILALQNVQNPVAREAVTYRYLQRARQHGLWTLRGGRRAPWILVLWVDGQHHCPPECELSARIQQPPVWRSGASSPSLLPCIS